jgi:hypothetical protein
MVTRRKTAALNLYISPDLKAAAEKTAKADHRSLTSLIEKLLTDAAVAAGFLEKPGAMPVQKPGAKRAGRRKG